MAKTNPRLVQRDRRHSRVRRKIRGDATCPRLCVYKSVRYIYAQLVDDVAGHTLAAASSREAAVMDGLSSTKSVEAAKRIGAALAERAKGKGVERVVFDRSGFPYDGRGKAVGGAAREGGLIL